MKNKLAQLFVLTASIDRRYLQFAYFVFVILGLVFTKSPADGSGGGRV